MHRSVTSLLTDEGYIDANQMGSVQDCEELAYKLLASLPRSRLAIIQRRIAPLLQFDVVGSLPTEVSLQIFSHLPFPTLLVCALVSRRWKALANDQSLWKDLCQAQGWKWCQAPRSHTFNALRLNCHEVSDSDDEGMGDSDEEEEDGDNHSLDGVEAAKLELTRMHAELDSGFFSTSLSSDALALPSPSNSVYGPSSSFERSGTARFRRQARHSAPALLKTPHESSFLMPDYKLLYQTHIKLRGRFMSSSYRLSALQTQGAPTNAHTSTIYCLQLYTYSETGKQVLFTGSRDKTVREWNLSTGMVERVISGVHNSSVLSICVHNGYLASAGGDRQVAIWHLESDQLVKVLCEHDDSVLCVRFDDRRLVSCSKDRTVRIYSFPQLELQYVLGAHRSAVNAVSLSGSFIVSASGDRSIRLWDADTGKLLRTFENHHSRGIASIDFCPPIVLSGSSDKHLRLFDMTTLQGWSTSLDYKAVASTSDAPLPYPLLSSGSNNISAVGLVCQACGSNNITSQPVSRIENCGRCVHGDLVRSVALGQDFVLSGSYDLSIKVWDRKTGALVADLTGGHTGRIFCVGFDFKKIVSCGDDQRICVWDFSHGIDTSFIP
ncbi:F-box/WD repeat-containing protein 11 [Phlegmacium glaucopus]|nr:F-box/WD repeat-containing protein 11 [Phlegmacium glaucopus]